jgi:hypothetical protein
MVARSGRPHQLITLREAYESAVQAGQLDAHWRKRWDGVQHFGAWLAQPALPALSLEQAVALYHASGGSRTSDFKANSIDEIRDSLDFLLYDTIKLESRFEECVAAEGAFQLEGAGPGFMSYLLCLREPDLFGIWNRQAERTLKVLELYPATLGQGHWGLRYIDLLDALQGVRSQMGLADFREVDRFACWLAGSVPTTNKPGGRVRTQAVTGG